MIKYLKYQTHLVPSAFAHLCKKLIDSYLTSQYHLRNDHPFVYFEIDPLINYFARSHLIDLLDELVGTVQNTKLKKNQIVNEHHNAAINM